MQNRRNIASSGPGALIQSARPDVVAAVLLRHAPIFVLLLAPPLIAAALEGAEALAWALAVPTAVAAVTGYAARRLQLPDDLRRVEAMAALGLVFLIGTGLSVPAFMALGMAPVDALFEATSGVTTTGLSVAVDAESWPVSAHLLRAWLQWCGGLAIATAALALLLGPGLPAQQISEAGMENEDYLTSSRSHARQLLVVYAALTLAGMIGCAFLLPSWWEALVLPLAAVSTGGFAPRADSLASYGRDAQALIVGLSWAGSVSLFTIILIGRGRLRRVLSGTTLPVYAGLTAGGMLVFGGWNRMIEGWEAGALATDLLNYVSAQSTAGFSVGPVAAQGTTPATGLGAAPLLLILAMVIGAETGSTGGGMKLGRATLLAQMLRLTLTRIHAPPHAVLYLRHLGQRVEPGDIIAIAAVAAMYGLSVLVLWFAFLAAGMPALEALFDVVSAISTVGLSAGAVGPDLAPGLKLLTALGMMMGRLEFLVVIVLLSPRTWIRRR